MKQKKGYYVTNHACFILQYHLVLVTKYRCKVIVGKLKDYLIEYTNQYFSDRDLRILEINTDKDHIHIMFEAYPNLNLAKLIGTFKSQSSKEIQIKFKSFLQKYYRKAHFYSETYFICTVSEKSLETVKKYIKNQGLK